MKAIKAKIGGALVETLNITHNDIDYYLKLYDLPLNELQKKANDITRINSGNKVECCSIISAKTGKCPENCSYCSQSSHSHTNCESHDLLDIELVINAAKDAKKNGASRFCVVTSGKGIESKDFETLLEMVTAISKIEGLHSCCSLGIISFDQAIRLKEAGVERFNHNVNTARSFYHNICTTHGYHERIETAKNIIDSGIELCCGGIIGMGETRLQRVEMALEIKELNPTSVPINVLHPIPGTPLENIKEHITSEEILKTIAIYRLIMPDVFIRYAGGRKYNLSENEQLLGLKGGINALLIGNYLTTIGLTPEFDQNLIKQAGLEIIKG